ncbi:MAG TPA: alpha/beta fold hydrolase [Gemmatimonadaceae bacterium]|nr:alpha/beta fold hydrolase [Gemmatimonadaceae bacterium]
MVNAFLTSTLIISAACGSPALGDDPAFVSRRVEPIEWESFTFTSDAGETTAAERGWLVVPERRGSPSGRTIRLPVLRFRTTAARPGTPIVFLAGGPGGSGLRSARRDQYFPVAMAMRELADVVFFDQRGTGTAEPSLVVQGTFALPAGEPLISPASRAAFAASASKAAAEIRSRGIDLAAYNTDESADDVDALRRALDAPRISLWGHSYGSHLAFAVVRRHEARLERIIVGGVNGPDQRWRYPSDGDELIERIDSAVALVPKLARQMPSVGGALRKGFESLAANPVIARVDSLSVLVGATELQTMIILQSGESDMIKRLPLIASMIERRQVGPFAAPIRAALKERPLGTAMTYAMHIASGVSPERRRRIEAERAGALFGDAINLPFSDEEFRKAWGVRDLGSAYRRAPRSSVPALFLTGTFDGRTSARDAEAVRAGFTNSAHILIAGASHDFYVETPAIRDAMIAFLRGERLRDGVIRLDVEFHGPDEPALVAELTGLAREGLAPLLARVREMARPESSEYLTSYVIEGVAGVLQRSDPKSPVALGLLRLGTEIFPRNAVLQMRLGRSLLAVEDRAGAATAYRRAVEINPMLRFASVQLAKLGG